MPPPPTPPTRHPTPPRIFQPGLQFAGAVAYAALNELLFQPKEYQVGHAGTCWVTLSHVVPC